MINGKLHLQNVSSTTDRISAFPFFLKKQYYWFHWSVKSGFSHLKANDSKSQLLCLHVSFDKRSKHAILLLQQNLRFAVLQNVPSLHHNDQIGCEDGVDAVLHTVEGHNTKRQLAAEKGQKKHHNLLWVFTKSREFQTNSCCTTLFNLFLGFLVGNMMDTLPGKLVYILDSFIYSSLFNISVWK